MAKTSNTTTSGGVKTMAENITAEAKKAALYARYSSRMQTETSIEAQKDGIR